MRLLALDAGTSGGKALVFDDRGSLLAAATEPWTYEDPPGLEMVGKEFDANAFWAALVRCARRALKAAKTDRVDAVAATSMRQGNVFLDAEGHALLATPNLDARGLLYASEVEAAVGADRLYALTGHYPPWIFAAARLEWLRREEPKRFARLDKVLLISDWMTWKLSGEFAAEPTGASETMLFDVGRRAWAGEILDALGFPATYLPELREVGAPAGKLTRTAASALGLSAGIPVVVGGADTELALLGAGLTEEAQVGIVLGSTAPVQCVLGEARLDPHGRLWTSCHAPGDRWVVESNALAAGKLLRWWREAMAPDGLGDAVRAGGDPYAFLMGLAEAAPPGCHGTLAFLGPDAFDLRAINPAKPAGFLFPAVIEPRTHSHATLLRALLENIAFGVRACLEQVDAFVGRPIADVTLCGGMTRSDFFCRLVAETLGRPVRVASIAEATGAGAAAAMLHALDGGTWAEAAARVARTKTIEDLDPERVEVYQDTFETWQARNAALASIA